MRDTDRKHCRAEEGAMRKFSFPRLVLAIALLSLTPWSCDTLYSNQFAVLGLGQIDAGEVKAAIVGAVANEDPGVLIENSGIKEMGVTGTFLQAVAESGQRDGVVDLLRTVADDPLEPLPTREAAAVIVVEILIQESGEAEFLDNLVSSALGFDFEGFDFSNHEDLSRLLAALLPSGAKQVTYPEGWNDSRIIAFFDGLRMVFDEEIQRVYRILVEYVGVGGGPVYLTENEKLAIVATLVELLRCVDALMLNTLGFTYFEDALVYLLERSTNILEDFRNFFGDISSYIPVMRNDEVLRAFAAAFGYDLDALLDRIQPPAG